MTTLRLRCATADNIIAEFDDDGNVLVEYTTEPDFHGRPISMTRDGHTYTFHDDGFGNVLALTDENGNVTDTYSHTAFGELVERTGTTVNPLQWQGMNGYYTDEETGTVNVRRRTYDPEIGRWLSIDPLAVQIPLLRRDILSAYLYCENNPIELVDPSGLAPLPVSENKKLQSIGKCGAADIYLSVSFGKKGAPCEGFLFQHINIKEASLGCDACTPCGKLAPKITSNFYELLGIMVTGEIGTATETDKGYTDLRRAIAGKVGQCGKFTSVGEMRLYCYTDKTIVDFKELADWRPGKESGIPVAGTTLAVKKTPGFWKKVPDYTKLASVDISWDCCKKEMDTNPVVAFADIK